MTTEKRFRRRTFLYFYILLALLTLLVVASYTWFSISWTPRVSDMDLFILSRTGLQLATAYDADEAEWSQEVSFLDMVTASSPLRPVTWSQQQGSFLAVTYGFDGRMTDEFQTLTDTSAANRTDGEGYYVLATFYARTASNCTVSLADAVEVNGGENSAGTYVIGTPVWNTQTLQHEDAGNGAETAVRLGFLITEVNPTTGQALGDSTFYIYEPNDDSHIDGSTGYVETPSVDGTDTLGDRLILQTSSDWSEASPVQREVTIKTLGSFTSDTTLFTLMAGEMVQIKLYIWLEGQDVDCSNQIADAQLTANVQFDVALNDQTGLVDIPKRR